MRTSSAATRTRASLHGNAQPHLLDLPVTSCSCPCTSSLHGRNHPAGNYSLLPVPHHTCSHDVTRALKKKKTSQTEGFTTRAQVLCPSVTCAVRSANRTHCAGHVEFHTRARPENPSIPNPSVQPTFCPSRDRLHSPRTFLDRVSLPQASTWRSRALHGPNLALAAVQTRRGSQ